MGGSRQGQFECLRSHLFRTKLICDGDWVASWKMVGRARRQYRREWSTCTFGVTQLAQQQGRPGAVYVECRRSDRYLSSSGSTMTFLWWLAAISFVGFLASLWYRDRERTALCRSADVCMRDSALHDRWAATSKRWLSSTREMQRIGILRQNASAIPPALQESLRRYLLIRWLPIFFLIAMAVAGLIANSVGTS